MDILSQALANVLSRKRRELLDKQISYDRGCRDKGGPTKGLGSEIDGLRKQVSVLQEIAEQHYAENPRSLGEPAEGERQTNVERFRDRNLSITKIG